MSNLVERKICKDCNIEKPVEEFYKNPSDLYYSNSCRICFNDRRRNKYKRNLESKGSIFEITHSKTRTKICRVCNIEKRLSKDIFNFNNSLGYSPICKSCEETNGIYKERKKRLEIGELKYCIDCHTTKDLSEFTKGSKVCRSCLNKKYTRDTNNQKISSKFSAYRKQDFRKGLYFNLTKDFIKENLLKPCYYCGYKSTGLDRIDNNSGHTIENTVPCCKECNYARNRLFSFEEMKRIGVIIRQIKLEREKNNA